MSVEEKDTTEESKIGVAVGGIETKESAITEEEKKLINLFRNLRMDLNIGGTPEEVGKFLADLNKRLPEEKEVKPLKMPADVKPKIPIPSVGTKVTTPSTGTTVLTSSVSTILSTS